MSLVNVKINSKNNNLIKEIKKLTNSKKYREKEKKFVIEGLRLCEDAVKSGVNICDFLYTDEVLLKNKEIIRKIKKVALNSHVISETLLNYVSETKSPQGFVCICQNLDKDVTLDKISSKDKIIVLENIQDPSNLGTILRTAEALHIDSVVLSNDCCDRYSPKVLRGSMGAIFRLPIFVAENLTETIKLLRHKGIKAYAAVPDRDALSVKEADFNVRSLVVIGNEGNGLKLETINSCDKKVTIPMKGRAESLNASVAASIIMWEMV